ncbi:MAG: alanine racemase [Desulfobulbaceae bacterium]|nr:alanine racemase [Desulfobulbaceae bacterium]
MTTSRLQAAKEVPTPFILIKENVLRQNIFQINSYAKKHGYFVRPHIKTHKSSTIASMQMEDDVVIGFAASKVGEVEALSETVMGDILMAYPTLGVQRLEYLVRLSYKSNIIVAIDTEYALKMLARVAKSYDAIIGVLVIFDAGLHRCGISDPKRILELVRFAANHPNLRFDGIQMYLGHLYGNDALSHESFTQINNIWEPVYDILIKNELRPTIVSSGSTPSLYNTHLISHVTEIRVGTAYLNDYFVLKFNHCKLESCAAMVVSRVISDIVDGQVIIDAGSKALSAKQLLRNENLEMGYVLEYPEARIFRLHEEHGWVDVSRCPKAPSIGECISIVPVNVALCMNLFDTFYLYTEEGNLQKEKIEARGCVN